MSDRMNPVAKALWLTALRSGDYLQVKNILKGTQWSDALEANYVGHCCLGVLSEVAPKECGEFKESHGEYRFVSKGQEEYSVLPATVKKWSGISTRTGEVLVGTFVDPDDGIRYDFRTVLTALNDEYGLTFEQIADVVEYAL